MSDIKFDEQSFGPDPRRQIKKTGGIAKLIISTGLAKDEKQANIIMIGLMVMLCLITFFTLRSNATPAIDVNYDVPLEDQVTI